METVYWLIGLAILLIIEIATLGLTTIWFAGGALAAAVCSLIGVPIWGQIAVFVGVSAVLLIFTRPWAMRYLNSRKEKTNYESLIGTVVNITEQVNNRSQTGTAVAGGQEWTARSTDDGQIIEAGTLAKVVRIAGVKLIVEEYRMED